jgi:serine/threonine protein kinase
MTTGKQYAIKILKQDIGESALKTIMTEINALKAIKKHPNVVTLYDYDQ